MELYIKLEDLHVFYAINLYDGKAWMLYTLVDKLPGFKKVAQLDKNNIFWYLSY